MKNIMGAKGDKIKPMKTNIGGGIRPLADRMAAGKAGAKGSIKPKTTKGL